MAALPFPSHVGAAADSLHEELIEQLKAPGRMFIPVSDDNGGQAIYVVDKDKDGKVTKKKTMNVMVITFLSEIMFAAICMFL